MSQTTRYRKYHPKLYRTRMPIFWWVRKWTYVLFITRELTSVFVAFYAIELLFLLRTLTLGQEAYDAFVVWLQTPVALALNTIAFSMILFHSITWFNLAPKAMVIRVGEVRIPPVVVAGLNYLGWVVVSAALAWFVLSA